MLSATPWGVQKPLLIDATPLQSEHRLRGVGSYLRHLIVALEQLKVSPYYLVSDVGREHVRDLLPEVRTLRVPRPHRPAQVYWLYNELALRAALWRCRPATFLAPDFNGLVRNPFGRTVAVLHDLTALKLAERGPKTPGLLFSDLRWRAYAAKLKQADRLLAVSRSAKEDAMALLDIPETRIRVVHHGLEHEHFRPSTGRGPYAGHPPYFVNIGGRDANKNQARILAAFARVARGYPELQLLFAGPWREEDVRWLEARAAELGLTDRARYLGYIPGAELPSLYGNALGFVFPSLEEGFGLPVLEAMASGAPVITSDRSSLPEVAGDAALLVDPLSADALADAMCRLLHARQRDLLRHKGTLRAAQFTWRRTACETLAALGVTHEGNPCG